MMRKDLTQGGVWRNVTTFLLPYILAYFLQILYGLADLFVIGMYCDVDSTTAVSNGAQVMYFVTCVVIGLAMGTTVNTAHAIGAKDYRRASRVIGTTATMFLSLSVVLACALLCFRHAIVGWVGTPPEAVAGTVSYLTVCFMGIPFIMAYNVIASIFRGLGDSKSPMCFVAVASSSISSSSAIWAWGLWVPPLPPRSLRRSASWCRSLPSGVIARCSTCVAKTSARAGQPSRTY